jgi:high-affinity K+ transport system ATPase subunit B
MSRVWQHAPAWKKNLDIQKKLRSLSLEDGSEIYKGASAIYNSALNPNTQPNTGTDTELNFINNQNVTKHKKSKLEGLAFLSDLLKNDVTEQFLRRFDDFFKTIIYTGKEYYYISEQGDN